MFFSVSPIKPGFRRRRRAAPLRLFQFLRNFFFLLLLSRSAFFFLFFQARARFLVALLLSEYLFLTSKQQRHRCRTPRLRSAASGCVSPISPCSDARDGRRLDCFLFNLNFQLILGARGFQLKIQTDKGKNRVFGKNIFPENLTKISIFSINFFSKI